MRTAAVFAALLLINVLSWLLLRRHRATNRVLVYGAYGAVVGLSAACVTFLTANDGPPGVGRALVTAAAFAVLQVVLNRRATDGEPSPEQPAASPSHPGQ